MLEMFEAIRSLEKRVSFLENDNALLKERVKVLEDEKVEKRNENDKQKFRRLWDIHIKTVKINGKNHVIFYDDGEQQSRYSIISFEKKMVFWASLSKTDRYQPLCNEDLTYLHKTFKCFGLSTENNEVGINQDIYNKCITKFGINLKGDQDKEDDDDEEEEEENEKQTEMEEKDILNMFSGGILKQYKEIYTEYGEKVGLYRRGKRQKIVF